MELEGRAMIYNKLIKIMPAALLVLGTCWLVSEIAVLPGLVGGGRRSVALDSRRRRRPTPCGSEWVDCGVR